MIYKTLTLSKVITEIHFKWKLCCLAHKEISCIIQTERKACSMKKCWNVILVWLQMVIGGTGSVRTLLYTLLPLHHLFFNATPEWFPEGKNSRRHKNWFVKIGLSASSDRERKPAGMARSICQLYLCVRDAIRQTFLSYLNVSVPMASLHVTLYLRFRSNPLLRFVLNHHWVKHISVLVQDPTPNRHSLSNMCSTC